MPTDNEFTKILGWPGYRVYRHEINERARTLRLWVRRKRGNRILRCPRCRRRVQDIHDVYEREVRDLPCFELQTAVIIELYRIRCPDCGVKAERVELLPGKAPYSKRFEDAVGRACESAAARQVARRVGLAESTVRAIDLRYLERWEARRRQPPLRQMGVDEIYKGKKDKFLTVVCNLETGEPLWFGKERKKETLDDFFRSQLVSRQRKRIEAVCVDMWEPFRKSLENGLRSARSSMTPLRSTQKRPFFSFGHSWVVFSLHVSFPFAPGKVWALPILVRLYRKRKKSKLAPGRNGKSERKQTGQATGEAVPNPPPTGSGNDSRLSPAGWARVNSAYWETVSMPAVPSAAICRSTPN